MTILSSNHNLLFVHVPKCGGSSVEVAFQPHVRWGDFVIGSTDEGEILHRQVFDTLYGVNKHSTASELKAVLGDTFDRMKVVTVVREPLKVIESYYRFSKSVHGWLTKSIIAQNPGISAAAAEHHAVELVRSGRLDDDPLFSIVNLLSGTIKAGVLSQHFGEFLRQTGDQRWTNYFSRYLCDPDGRLLATHVLKLEEAAGIRQFFRSNVSVQARTFWTVDERRQFVELTRSDYDLLGYPASRSGVRAGHRSPAWFTAGPARRRAS